MFISRPLALLALAGAAASCARAPDPSDDSHLAEARQAVTVPTCVTIARGALGDVADATLNAGGPTKTYGGAGSITASSGSSGLRQGLIRFDLSPIPAGATVTSATATLTTMLYGGAPIAAHRVLSPWSESTVTWSSFAGAYAPAVDGTFAATATPSVDLTALVQAWVSGSQPNHGLLLERTVDGSTVFASSEHIASMRPKLDVCYVAATCTDGVQNQGETGVDCGGPCAPCDLCLGVTCPPADACHQPGTCDPVTGQCGYAAKLDGTACDDGDPNTVSDVCTQGVCAGMDACAWVTCPPADACHHPGTCTDHATGACTFPAKANGTTCDDGDWTTTGDVCTNGVCVGTAVVTWYRDADGDGHGDPAVTLQTWPQPAGYVAIGDDCDDGRADVHPGAMELCDGIDHDCDGRDSAGSFAWASALPVSFATTLFGFRATPGGGALLAGTFSGSVDLGGGPLVSAGGRDIYLVALDASGHHVWSRRFGGAQDDWATGMAIDAQGNILLAGSFAGTVDLGTGPLAGGAAALFLAALSPSGDGLAARAFPGGGSVTDVAVGPAGEVTVVGYAPAGVDFGGGPLPAGTAQRGFSATFDASLVHLRTRAFSAAGGPASFALGVAYDTAGNLYVTGAADGSADLGGGALGASGRRTLFVSSYGPSGAWRWTRGAPTATSSVGRVAVDSVTGRVYVSGSVAEAVDFGAGGVYKSLSGAAAGYVTAFDLAGGPLWSKSRDDASLELDVDASGHVVTAVTLDTRAWEELESYAGTLGYLESYDADGQLVSSAPFATVAWSDYYNGWGTLQGGARVAATATGRVHLAGSSIGTVTLGSQRVVSSQNAAFVATFDAQPCTLCPTWYRDADGDGHGDPSQAIQACVAPPGHVLLGDDGDDALATVHPGAPEVCNGIDDDGDGNVDDGAYLWARQLGDAGYQSASGVVADASGGSIVFATGDGTIDFGGGPLSSPSGPAGQMLAVARLDAAGQHVWSRALTATSLQGAVDSQGNVVLAGRVHGTADLGGGPLSSIGYSAVLLAKLDASGNHLWSKVLPLTNPSFGGAYATGVAVTSGGDPIVAGTFSGTLDLGGGPLPGVSGGFVARFDGAGHHVWSRKAGDGTRALVVAVDAVDDIVLGGSIYTTSDLGGGPLAPGGVCRGFVAKLDPAGHHLWSRASGDVAAVAVGASGEIAAGGSLLGSMDLGTGSITASAAEGWAALLDASGQARWVRALGATAGYRVPSVVVTGDGDVVFSAPGNPASLHRVSAGGALRWQKRTPGVDFFSVAADAAGNVLAGGRIGPVRAQLGAGVLEGRSYDALVAKFAPACLP